MTQLLNTLEIVVSIVMVFTILLQHRASGLSATFGGSGSSNFIQRRGAEKVLFKVTIWSAFLFLLIPVVQWFVF
ncbi:preprotein translocase subunit SecG [Patescibacteria group bacterium]|nr:preprotein translocase subunit SecG [Patescibacteria group bacterium]MBU1123682.1 preprotein translocase subunit SecG [Patescibacteria group bacterium]MBU1911498.1 preprotein translocase subunit SecG [Patescibacteria group bacterium]